MDKIKRSRTAKKRGERGLAALEFALTLAIWIPMLLGIVDGSYYLLINERTDRIAYTVTDVITQYQTLTLANLNDIMAATSELMQPISFNPSNLCSQHSTGPCPTATGYIIVTSVFQPATGNPVVEWQYTWPPSAPGVTTPTSNVGTSTIGSQAVLPSGLTLNSGDNVIITEVFFSFSPLFLDQFLSRVVYREAVYKPRLSPLTTPPS